MDKIIATQMNNGGVALTYPNYNRPGMTEDEILADVIEKNQFQDGEYTVIAHNAIPYLGPFRNALKLVNGQLAIDMEMAKNIQRDRWRAARAPLLDALDVAYQRADETNNSDEKASIVAVKNQLRNVTNTDLSAVTTTQELEAVWPSCLGGIK